VRSLRDKRRHIDLDRAQLAVIVSAWQTRDGVKKSKGRTVTLPAMVVAELRAHRLREAVRARGWRAATVKLDRSCLGSFSRGDQT
jgi:hypothetical protein